MSTKINRFGIRKGGKPVATEVIEKRKVVSRCAECQEEVEVAKGEDSMATCPHCGAKKAKVKKSLVIVRKEELDDDIEDVEDEDDEDEEEEEEEEEDEDDDEEDEDDDEDEEEDEPAELTKSDASYVGVEALGLASALATEITKVFTEVDLSKRSKAYEKAMTDFNGVMDVAAGQWLTGSTVVEKSNRSKQLADIRSRVEGITKATKEGAEMPAPKRPEGFDELPDDVKEYVTGLEAGQIDKRDEEDIYKGLTPAAAAIVKKAAETNEENEKKKYLAIVDEELDHLPVEDREELAKSLREAAEKSPAAYDVVLKALKSANGVAESSDIFSSLGRPGGGEPTSEIAKRQKAAEELVSKGEFPTIEQAEVHLMRQNPGKNYRMSNEAQH